MVVRYEGWMSRVASDQPGDLEWLRGFVSPGFEMSVGGAASSPPFASRVSLREDRVVHEQLRAVAVGSGREETAFLQDSGTLRIAVGDLPDGSVAAYEPTFKAAYRFAPCGDISIYDSPGPRAGRHARGALMRAVRERAMDHVLRTGGVILHAAAAAYLGRAILFAGAKRSGKTSLLSALLGRCKEFSFLSNDRVVLVPEKPRVRARALPSIVSIRPDSLRFVPGLDSHLSGIVADYCGRQSDHGNERSVPPLSPRQYVDALETGAVGVAAFHSLVFPRIDAGIAGFTCREMRVDDVLERPSEFLFGHASLGDRTGLFASPASGEFPAASVLLERARGMLQRVRCHELSVGRDAYTPANTRALGDALVRLMES